MLRPEQGLVSLFLIILVTFQKVQEDRLDTVHRYYLPDSRLWRWEIALNSYCLAYLLYDVEFGSFYKKTSKSKTTLNQQGFGYREYYMYFIHATRK